MLTLSGLLRCANLLAGTMTTTTAPTGATAGVTAGELAGATGTAGLGAKWRQQLLHKISRLGNGEHLVMCKVRQQLPGTAASCAVADA
jgi:hypothetical protein